MHTVFICETDNDYFALIDAGYPKQRVYRDAYNLDADLDFERLRKDHKLRDAVIVTDCDCPQCLSGAEAAAAFLGDVFRTVRVLALPGGVAELVKGGDDAFPA